MKEKEVEVKVFEEIGNRPVHDLQVEENAGYTTMSWAIDAEDGRRFIPYQGE